MTDDYVLDMFHDCPSRPHGCHQVGQGPVDVLTSPPQRTDRAGTIEPIADWVVVMGSSVASTGSCVSDSGVP